MSYLHGISCENYRVFAEKQDFNFAPITILTGPNSSGKSSIKYAVYFVSKILDKYKYEMSFTELMKLLFTKQEVDEVIQELGGFKNFTNRNKNDNKFSFSVPFILIHYKAPTEIVFNFRIEKNINEYAQLYSFSIIDSLTGVIIVKATKDENSNSQIDIEFNFNLFYDFNEYFLKAWKEVLKNYWDENNSIYSNYWGEENDDTFLIYNRKNNEFTTGNEGNIKFNFATQKDIISTEDVFMIHVDTINKLEHIQFGSDLFENINTDSITNEMNNPNSKNKAILSSIGNSPVRINLSLNEKSDDDLIKAFNKKASDIYIKNETQNQIDKLSEDASNLNTVQKILKTFASEDYTNYSIKFDGFFKIILDELKESWLLSSISTPEINGIKKYNFQKRTHNINSDEFKLSKKALENATQLKLFINKWLNRFDIAENFDFELSQDIGSFIIIKDGIKFNVADEGYGTSRLLPLIIQIANTALQVEFPNNSNDNFKLILKSGKCLFIEEPENGLHPKFQSLLVDMLVEAYESYEIQFVIETHSEYIIRKFQLLTANAEINPDKTQIYYFYHPNHVPDTKEQCYGINILRNGALSRNFGKGFFDESSSLIVGLYNKTKINDN